MNQVRFGGCEYTAKKKRARRKTFLREMEQAVHWKRPTSPIEPHSAVAVRGRRPYQLSTMLRIHLM